MPDPMTSIDALLATATFRKSRRSDSSGSCVLVGDNLAAEHGVVFVSDTKNPDDVLAFPAAEWAQFLEGICRGEFDL